MSGTSSVPSPSLGPRGFIAPAEADILAGVFADLNAAFGGNLNTALETPQGQLASSTTAIIGDKNDQFLLLANGVDPAYASGRMQDAIGRIYYIERHPAEPTVVLADCTGLLGTVIPLGALAVTTDGNLFICTGGGTIDSSGTVTLSFACTVDGPIACPSSSLSTIYQAIPGWDSINNPGDGVLGSVVESRADFEFRRAQSVALNSLGTIGAVRGAVLAVPDVLDAYVTENYTGSPAVTGGVTLDPNSLYVAVSGGASQAIAEAIWSKKPPGCAYTGTTTVTVYDTNPGYTPPGIPYSVKFKIATPLTIFFDVQIANNAGVPANAVTLIQNAIIAAFDGADGGMRARIGAPIFASRFYAGVALLGSWAEILAITIGSTNGVGFTGTGSITATTLTISAVTTGSLDTGDFLYGVGVLPNTVITGQIGGTPGGIGTYSLNLSQTVGSETMGALSALNTITTNIDQAPTVSPTSIAVTVI